MYHTIIIMLQLLDLPLVYGSDTEAVVEHTYVVMPLVNFKLLSDRRDMYVCIRRYSSHAYAQQSNIYTCTESFSYKYFYPYCNSEFVYVRMYVCMYCMYVCMYVCLLNI